MELVNIFLQATKGCIPGQQAQKLIPQASAQAPFWELRVTWRVAEEESNVGALWPLLSLESIAMGP